MPCGRKQKSHLCSVVFYFSILNIVQVYFFPLIVTVVCYSLILWKISEESSAKKKEAEVSSDALLRRSGVNTLERARSRTLRMTFVIVVAFICCWTPYAIMMFLHFLTKTDWIPKDVRKFIYAFAVFNSAISPYLYGYFSFDVKKELKLLFTCSRTTASDRHLSCSANVVRNSSSQRIRKRSASATHLVPPPPKTVTPVLTTRGHSLRTAKKPVLINKSATTLSPQTALRI
ncbi:hypothetical protein Y032_0001g353 [Ancylostoma ceylanicum]|uniref:G-protein coupled receptors family 1 profile domain-containing protein n=1 Tax=Ancylostoma ceylanicum TaxID=53326 RepID=A0A016W5K8_9BILA|nr:hypothetical protein Y032_0001g353 [Ancylostoma ceylanicum]